MIPYTQIQSNPSNWDESQTQKDRTITKTMSRMFALGEHAQK